MFRLLIQPNLTTVYARRTLSILLLLSLPAIASSEVKSPQHIEGVVLVGAEGVIELMQQMSDMVLIDSRIPGDRHQGYIESSVSLPDTETSCETLAKAIPTKTTPALFYCNGVKCGRSAVAINIAKQCGYKELYWFRGGFEVWLEKKLPYIQN